MTLPSARSNVFAGASLDTLGGVDLNGANFGTKVGDASRLYVGTRPREVLDGLRSDDSPEHVGTRIQAYDVTVTHTIPGEDASTQATNINRVKRLLYSRRHGARTLVLTDIDGIQKDLTVVATEVLQHSTGIDYGVLTATWRVYSSVKLDNAGEQTVSESGATSDITLAMDNDGTEYSPAVRIEVTPTGVKPSALAQDAGFYITLVNRNAYPVVAPICITDNYGGSSGWGHNALVSAGDSQADGDDVELLQNRRRIMRWSDNWNNAATRVWSEELSIRAGRWWTYNGGSTLTAGATSMTVREPLERMPPLPFYAAFVEATGNREVVLVTAYDTKTGTFTITRAQRDTAAATHANGVKLYHVPPECLLELIFGWSNAPTPKYLNADYKPVFDLSTSDNGVWRYTNFGESEAAAEPSQRKPRAGSWAFRDTADRSEEATTGQGQRYLNYIPRTATLTTDAATWSRMCMAYRSAGALTGHPLISEWYLRLPYGSTQIAFTQDTSTLDWNATPADDEAQLQVIAVGFDGDEELLAEYFNDTASAETETPTSNAYEYIFRMRTWNPALDSATVEIQADEPTDGDGAEIRSTVVVTYDSDEEILVLWGTSQRTIYQLGRPDDPFEIANSDGDTLYLYGPVLDVNDTLEIDVAARSVTMPDGTNAAHLTRGDWPELPPDDGEANTGDITLTDSAWGTVDADGYWKDAWS